MQASSTSGATVCWPAPPGSGYPSATEHAAPLACVVHFAHSRLAQGHLLWVDFLDRIATVSFSADRPADALHFDRFLSLALTRPLTPDPPRHRSGTVATARSGQRPRTPYRLLLKDGRELGGQTIGYLEKPVGLFLFPPIDPQDRIARLFVPKQACLHREIGEVLDDIRVEQSVANREQIEQVGALKRTLRSQKLGEILVRRKVDVEQFAVESGALQRVPLAVARRLQVLPLMVSDDLLVVGIEDVTRSRALDELEFATRTKVVPISIPREAIHRMLETAYLATGNGRNEAAAVGAASLGSVTPLFPAKRRIDFEPGS